MDFHAERVRRDEVVYLRLEGFGRVDAFEHGKVGERADGFVGPADHWFGEGFHGRRDAVGDAFVVVVGEVVAGAQGGFDQGVLGGLAVFIDQCNFHGLISPVYCILEGSRVVCSGNPIYHITSSRKYLVFTV